MENQIKDVHPDQRGRIVLGTDLTSGVSHFKVMRNEENGDIILRPYVEVPKYEMWLLENKPAMEGILRNFKEAESGKISDIDPKYLED